MARPPQKTADLKALKDDYDQKRSLYESFCHEIKAQLVELLLQENIILAFPIEERVKPWSSIVDKCQRNNLAPHALGDINDIAGLRIIVLFQRDQEKACDLISNNFQILSKENTVDRLADDQFGYGSTHFQIRPKEEWLSVPTLSKLGGLQAEIQVRTSAQHIWAVASHSLQYKSETHVPKPVRRAINRVAALLETVDLEFERVLEQREAYGEEIKGSSRNERLDVDLLRQNLMEELPSENSEPNDSYSELLDDLIEFKIGDADSLRELIRKHQEGIVLEDRERVDELQKRSQFERAQAGATEERLRKGVFFTHVGLVRLALGREFGTRFDQHMDNKVLQ
ncbi:MAG: hypothetical protein V3U79_00930 [Dehalococcoidia bacterium]